MSHQSELPIISPPICERASDSPTVAGIVLAAGTSSRFGDENKLLVEIDGKAVLTRSVQTLLNSKIKPIYVVVGNERHRVQKAIDRLDVRTIINESYSQGQATSVRTGVKAVRQYSSVDAVLIFLGDLPFVSPSTIDHLIATYQSGVGTIIVAGYQGQRGNPVLFDASYFDSLATISGDTGARHLIVESDDAILVETEDPGVVRDIDTPADLNHFDI